MKKENNKKKKITIGSCIALFVAMSAVIIGLSLGNNNNSDSVSNNSVDEKLSDLEIKQRQIYEMAKSSGYIGTYEEWLESIRGESIELSVFNNSIQWKYSSSDSWTSIVSLDDLMGEKGENGLSTVLRVENGSIQWKYDDETSQWSNLISLSELTGATGEDGADGREVLLQIAEGHIQWKYNDEESTWTNLVELSTLVGAKGDKGDKGDTGEDGADGREVLLQIAEGHIQWKYNDEESTWTNLVELSTLVGAKGDKGDKGDTGETGASGIDGREVLFQVSSGYIQWKYNDEESTWTNLVELSTLVGAKGDKGDKGDTGETGASGIDGREVLFQVSSGYIQWKYNDEESTWTNLVELSTLVGAKGDKGDKGAEGEDGTDGREVLFQVSSGYIQWKYNDEESNWINLVELSTLVGAKGDKGDKGDTGEDGADGREVLLQIAEGHIQWKYNDEESNWINLVELSTLVGAKGDKGDKGDTGETGASGIDGREVLFQVSSGYIQWKYNDEESTWTNLVELSTLVGAKGDKGDTGEQGEKGDKGDKGDTGEQGEKGDKGDKGDTGEQGEKGDKGDKGDVGEDGTDGREVLFQVSSGYIQWKYNDEESTWTNLVELESLKGTSGDKGQSAYEIAVELGFEGSKQEWLESLEGTDGLSAYEIYLKYHPDYVKSEEEWLEDLVNDRLASSIKYTVDFDSEGGTLISSQTISEGEKVEVPSNPTKEGYTFEGWYTKEGEKWSFIGYSVSEDITLYAKYIANTYTVVLNPNGGSLKTTSVEVTYGEKFDLPDAWKFKYDCVWTYNDVEIDESLVWLYAQNIELTAKWVEQDIIKISNADEFLTIREDLSESYLLVDDINFNGYDLEMFGDSLNPFTGCLDGNGYSLTNFDIYSTTDSVALFYSNEGTIKNLFIEDVCVDSIESTLYTALLAITNTGVISNCYTNDISIISHSEYVAGIITSNDSTTISSVEFVGTIIVNNDNLSAVGGLVALLNNSYLSDCKVNVDIKGENNHLSEHVSGNMLYGGLVAESINSNFTNIEVSGNIGVKSTISKQTINHYVGGVIAKINNASDEYTIEKCKSTINIQKETIRNVYEGSTSTNILIGGVVGEANFANVKKTFYTGELNNVLTSNASINSLKKTKVNYTNSGKQYLGGLIGNCNNVTCLDSYSECSISSSFDVKTSYISDNTLQTYFTANAYSYVGGLIGKSNSDFIENCYANLLTDNNVLATGTSKSGNNTFLYNKANTFSYLGGLIGMSSSNIYNSFANINLFSTNVAKATAATSSLTTTDNRYGIVIGNDDSSVIDKVFYITGFEQNSILGAEIDLSSKTFDELIYSDLGWDSSIWKAMRYFYPVLLSFEEEK